MLIEARPLSVNYNVSGCISCHYVFVENAKNNSSVTGRVDDLVIILKLKKTLCYESDSKRNKDIK